MRGDVVPAREIRTQQPPPKTGTKKIDNLQLQCPHFRTVRLYFSKNSSPGSAYLNSVEYLFHRSENQIILANRIHNQSIHRLSPSPTDPHRWSLDARW